MLMPTLAMGITIAVTQINSKSYIKSEQKPVKSKMYTKFTAKF